jgi:MoaA/NifB/PqqE/SkfB family radical SAM enzyme
MERLLELAVQLRVKSVHINFPYASGLWAESFNEVFSEDDMDRLRRLQRFHRSLLVLLEFPSPKAMCCAAKKSMIYINASGEVTPCPVIPFVIGDMRNELLAEIWKRHVDALKVDYRGKCPMNETAGREALGAHAALVLARDQRCGGVRGDAKET